jgi:TPR repeat protein
MTQAKKVGKKSKSCTETPDEGFTPIQTPPGQVLPGSVKELAASAAEAARAGSDVKAVHFYTMAIDLAAKGMPRNSNGVASDADLQAFNKSSEGQLVELLSGRSHMYLRQSDLSAAIEDADTCTRADPTFEKGHLRLAIAYEKAGAPLMQQLEACERGLEGCPGSELLVTRKWRLKKSIAETARDEDSTPGECQGQAAPWTIQDTKCIADNPADPRRHMAATDLGTALFAGAHGLSKDVDAAERYLRLGSEGGDIGAQRILGLLLLESGRPVEAAEELSMAAKAGDDEASSILQQLKSEAEAHEAEMRAKLKHMAELGDPRAMQILEELRA